jgi:hypothetical protein
MAVRKAEGAHPDVREYLAEDHERTVLAWATKLGADEQAERSRRWIAAVRAGKPIRVPWWALPEGTLPRGGRNPNDDIDIDADGTITWAPPPGQEG